jgi:DeoR/GlpR family transcriptional regulator of sugar metabolism
MLIVERQQKVLDLLRQRRTVQLEDVARELDVSVSTVRRDLEVLEEQGLVERTHGGAIYRGDVAGIATTAHPNSLSERMTEHVEQKQAIGAAAAALVKPHMTVFLDGGSTVVYAERQITARPIQVVTNSLAIAGIFADEEQVELLIVGGNLYPRTGVTIGPIATGCLAELHADLLLFSVAGIFGDAAFNTNMAMAEVEQAMMRQAARCVLLMDSSKFNRKSLTRVCSVSEVDLIITDPGVTQEWREQLGERLQITSAE